MLDQIQREVTQDPFYKQNFLNDGERFVAWYLRRVLLRDPVATPDDITDGQHDKQMDAVVVDDDDRRVLIVQGKFVGTSQVSSRTAPVRYSLHRIRLQDLPSLQQDCNERLKRKLEAVQKALEERVPGRFRVPRGPAHSPTPREPTARPSPIAWKIVMTWPPASMSWTRRSWRPALRRPRRKNCLPWTTM